MSDETPTIVPPAEVPTTTPPKAGLPRPLKLVLAIALVLAAGYAVYYSVKNEQAKDDDIRMQKANLEKSGTKRSGKGGG